MQASTHSVVSERSPRTAAQRALALSPIEQLFTGAGAHPITFGFSFTAPLDASALSASLAQTLRAFPTLQCRLVPHRSKGVGLRRDPSVGALRVAAEPLDVQSARAAGLDGRVDDETARFTLSPEGAGSRLTVSISHAVVDGFAFMQFMYAWARVARGVPLTPVVRERVAEGLAPGPVSAARVRADVGAFWLPERERPRHPALRAVQRRFHLDDLARERAAARAAYRFSLTDHDLICAHLWREFAPPDAEAETFLTCAVDARPLCANLGRSHFGCAITFATAALGREPLARAPVAEAAMAIHQAVGAVDERRIDASMRTLAALKAEAGQGALDEVHLTHPSRGLLVTNLARLPLQGLDFGAGPPSEFEPIVQLPRCAVLFSCPGGIEARVYLPA